MKKRKPSTKIASPGVGTFDISTNVPNRTREDGIISTVSQPRQISYDEYAKNWDRIFKKKK